MRISMIITTYNRPDMLSKVFEGLAYQTESADEVIVKDENSFREMVKYILSRLAITSGTKRMNGNDSR